MSASVNGTVLRWTTTAPRGPALPRMGTARKTGKRSSPIPAKCLYAACCSAVSVEMGRMYSMASPVMPWPTRSRTCPMAAFERPTLPRITSSLLSPSSR